MEISRELYEAFDSFELDDLKHLNIVDRHIEQSEVYDITLHRRSGQADRTVYTVEGNSGDKVARRSYPIGYGQIVGYGVPVY